MLPLLLATGQAVAQTSPLAGTTTPVTPSSDSAVTPSALAGGEGTSPIQVEKIVVGSRLHVSNVESPSPVTIISSRDILNSGATSIQDVLQRVPSSGTGGTYRTTTNGGQGLECYDLRNLGISRVLVLINGKRVVHTGIFGSDCVDLSDIPVNLVDQIQILKDGASSIYGADAVSGVVNIILKQDFSGTQLNASGGIAQAGDDRTGELSATSGFNFDHGRGNFTISGDYNNQGSVESSSRDYSRVPITGDNGPGQPFTTLSGFTAGGRVSDSPNVANPLGLDQYAAGNGKFPNYSSADRFNFNDFEDLLGSLETENVTAQSHYDINSHFTAYGNIFYNHKQAVTNLAPQPVSGSIPPSTLPDLLITPAGNPFNPFGEDVAETRRVVEFGGRQTISDVDTWQGTLGLRGQIVGPWNYDVSYSYGISRGQQESLNEVNYKNLEQELGFRQTFDPNAVDPSASGVYDPSVCQASAGCTLQNPFGPGSFNQAGIDYARFNEFSHSVFQLRDLNAGITNDHLFRLPYGPVGLAFGLEHRGEQGTYDPDPLVQSGVTLENAQQPTSGAFNATEVYGELHIPILANLPAAKDLSLDLSGRYSNYNTFGDAETFGIKGNWTPINDIRFRGSIGTAFRQPEINELYGGQSLSFNSATDPCVGAVGVVAANCLSKGINPATFSQPNQQIETIQGGNPALLPETAHTYTFGTVIQPRFIKNFAVTIDYWHTRIANEINTLDTQDIVTDCYNSPGLTNSFCSLIAPRNGAGQFTTVFSPYQNLGELRADGLDFGGNYLVLAGEKDSFTFATDFALSIGFIEQLAPNGPFVNFNGTNNFLANPQAGYPRLRNTSSATWNHGQFSLTYSMQYFDGMKFYPGSTYSPTLSRAYATNEVFFHNIELNYHFKKFNLVVGIDNILDKDPPFAQDGATNTNLGIYGVDNSVGRFFFIKTQYKFG